MASNGVPDLPGIHAPSEGVREIMIEVARLLQLPHLQFPGAQPVSFTRDSIQDLLNEDFLVCEKSDGLRCLMLLSEFIAEDGSSEERIYLLTRKNEVSWIQNLHVSSEPGNPRPFQVGTLIDGELIRTHDGKIRFLAFDILAHERKILLDRNLEKRLGYLDQLVCKPFMKFCQHDPQAAASFDFKIYMKPMSQSYRLDSVFSQEREHKSDGLIFTSVNAPYICGTDKHILKWKPSNENSMDFAMRLDFVNDDDPNKRTNYDAKPKITLLAWTGPSEVEYGEMFLSDAEWEEWKELKEPLNYRIVEVVQNEDRWRFLRFRDDKEHGNHLSVIKKIEQSIHDNLSIDELKESIPKIKEHWYARMADKKGVKRPRTE